MIFLERQNSPDLHFLEGSRVIIPILFFLLDYFYAIFHILIHFFLDFNLIFA